jgi:hypothetical protein
MRHRIPDADGHGTRHPVRHRLRLLRTARCQSADRTSLERSRRTDNKDR